MLKFWHVSDENAREFIGEIPDTCWESYGHLGARGFWGGRRCAPAREAADDSTAQFWAIPNRQRADGMNKNWPGCMTFGSSMPFALASLAAEMFKRSAIASSVSPAVTWK